MHTIKTHNLNVVLHSDITCCTLKKKKREDLMHDLFFMTHFNLFLWTLNMLVCSDAVWFCSRSHRKNELS